jgi:heterodisulfide reductase subunit A
MSPKLVEVGRHTNIELLTLSEVESISGAVGNFEVTLRQSPRYIDTDLCIACGTCAEKCPKRVADSYNAGLTKRKAAYIPYAQAVPLKYVIDAKYCIYFQKGGRCKACQKFCPTGAVNFEDKAKIHKIRVGAMILAPGFVPYSPTNRDTFSYGRHANVLTSLEFERILSSSGPSKGHLVRPSDQNEPRKIAWLQCVGSRDSHQGANAYCSTVCCTYAIKQALIAKEHSAGSLDAAIFYIDIRTQGKDFEKYYWRARDEKGVRFVKSKISTVMPVDDTGNLVIRYTNGTGKRVEEEFDMVILSVGLVVREDTAFLAEKFGISLDKYQFAATSSFAPVETSRPGIYVCGALQGPKDIPYSVMQASAAACAAGTRLAEVRGTLMREQPEVSQRVIAGEPPRVGVFICNCGVNIGGVVRVPEVVEYARSLPCVAYVEENLFTCSQDTQDKMKDVIKEHGLNRIVVAACSPQTHEALFQETLTQAGLNKYLFEMANIRNQCSWVHSDDRNPATEKAKDLVRMGVAKASRLDPLEEVRLEVNEAGLVIGSGIAGMTAALGLADQGFQVHLIEKEKALGGHGQELLKTWRGEDTGAFVTQLAKGVENHPLISLHLQSTVVGAEGFVGNFRSTIKMGEKTEIVEHGAVIIATGGHQLRPNEYHFGRHPHIFVSLDLDKAITTDPDRFKDVTAAVFIQCVGSREAERPYCSKVCCTQSIQNALRLKGLNPNMDIYILFRDIRTYGHREDIYREARSRGITFIRYSLEEKPQVSISNNNLSVTVKDQMLQMPVRIDADIVTLASAIEPSAENKLLSRLYKLSINAEGFFQEAHAKLRPVDFATDGIYMAGLAHGPKPVEEIIAQAQAAAARASALLASKVIFTSAVVAYSDSAFCSGCGVCAEICPFGAASLDAKTGKAQINPSQCKGCGLCVASCRSGALNLKGFDQAQTFAMIDEAMAS